jgi:hypothetical protein
VTRRGGSGDGAIVFVVEYIYINRKLAIKKKEQYKKTYQARLEPLSSSLGAIFGGLTRA